MKDSPVRTQERLGQIVRIRRKDLGWSQEHLARLISVDRKWVMHLEKGNAGAELGLVLKALNALQLTATLAAPALTDVPSVRTTPSKLDEVFARLRQPSSSK